jgi:ankyrin repeat protein
MKKSIICSGLALATFSNVAIASNSHQQTTTNNQLFLGSPTPLCVAISKGEIDMVKKLIEYGADVNEKSNGMTPLMTAARYNKVEIIKVLLSKGAHLKQKDEKGFDALKYAELSNATDAAILLKQ